MSPGCSFEGCDRKHSGLGFCRGHLQQHYRGKGITELRVTNPHGTLCLLDYCAEIASPRTEFCFYHLDQKNQGIPFRRRTNRARVGISRIRNEAGEKRCPRCSKWQAESEFYVCKHTADKRQPHCKGCYRDANRMSRFGMTAGDYARVLADQGGGCAICHTEDMGKRLSFSVDHDRSCCPGDKACEKCVRGILCTRCNTGLGQARDDVEILTSMVGYLNYWRKTNA